MANYNNLKTAIQDVIKANGNQEITGEIMQNALLSMINSLGAGYQFVSVATPETNPGTPDQKVFYIANGKGTYVNFGGLVVDEDEVVLLVYDDAWKKLLSGIASNSKLTELKSELESELESELDAIIDGQEQNYLKDKSYTITGSIIDSSGWGAFIEDIPCSAGDTILWNPLKIYSIANIVFFNRNGETITYYTANEKTRTLTAPANSSYLKCCFSMFDDDGNYNRHPLYVNGVEYRRLEYVPSLNSINTLSEQVSLLDSKDNRRLSVRYVEYGYGYIYQIDGTVLYGSTPHISGWNISDDYILVNPGDIVRWNFGKYTNSSQCLVIYGANKDVITYYTANTGGGTRDITMPSDAKYIRISFYETFNDKPNTVPVEVNGIPYFIDSLSILNAHDTEAFPKTSDNGVIGNYYPEEIIEVNKYLTRGKNSGYHRFQFLHISDNHNNSFGYAEDYLDYSPAKFLINTGDLVNDKFTDGAANTISKAIAPNKPVYLVLGNHDYSHAPNNQAVFDLFYGNSETEGTVNYHNVQAGGVAVDETYYSIDFATEKIKCIMLDMNDGWSTSELPNISPSVTTSGKMSQTQINWFVSELQSAKTNDYHVCIFIHTLPYNVDVDKRICDFCDVLNNDGLGINSDLTFLPSIIDGFINGGNVSFDYNGNSYSFTFTSGGHFVSWFCGHTHYDMAGWMQGHTDQFMINVCRPFADTSDYLGTYDGDKLGVHFNFVTVDTNVKSLSVYRVGQQKTIFATDRKSFSIIYK